MLRCVVKYNGKKKIVLHFTVHIYILSSSYLLDVVLHVNSDCWSDTSLLIFQLQVILVHLQDQSRAVDLIENCDVSSHNWQGCNYIVNWACMYLLFMSLKCFYFLNSDISKSRDKPGSESCSRYYKTDVTLF